MKVPFGLIRLMGSPRDCRFKSSKMPGTGGRAVSVPRGKLVGGSGSINSMVWFRGRREDYDAWNSGDWSSEAVWRAFDAVEAHTTPQRLGDPHPLSEQVGALYGNDPTVAPMPSHQSAGVFHCNMRNGRRWSAADAFLRPALARATSRC